MDYIILSSNPVFRLHIGDLKCEPDNFAIKTGSIAMKYGMINYMLESYDLSEK